ncbi:hypothetical protein ScPMuIL_009111 [Solemya velum]
MIKSHIQTAQLETEISAEIVYLLPFDQSAKFEKLFTEIEQKSSELGISSFGTSATTMEEVFLKVGETAEQESNDDSKIANGFNNSGYDSTGSNLQLVKDTHIQENVQLNHLNGPHFLEEDRIPVWGTQKGVDSQTKGLRWEDQLAFLRNRRDSEERIDSQSEGIGWSIRNLKDM